MGRGGPQPAHQVTPGDLQLEGAVLDLEDPEVFGHLGMPVGLLLSNNEISHMEGTIGELLDDDDDDEDESDDDVPKGEVIDEHEYISKGLNNSVIYNVNNNAKKSRKSARKRLSSVLHRVDTLLQDIIYRHKESKWNAVVEEQDCSQVIDEFMNKTCNNKYLSSIEEEDTETNESTTEKCQRKKAKNNKADPSMPSGESIPGAVSKRRIHGSRRILPGLWRGVLCETPRSVFPIQLENLRGDGNFDYRELRKGMGDVMDATSELNNLVSISDNDKAELNNDDCKLQSPGKPAVVRSPLDELDQTTAADFSSYLDPGSDCWNAENASQTTLIDDLTLGSSLSSPTVQEQTAASNEADKALQSNQGVVQPISSGRILCKDNLNRDLNIAKTVDENQLQEIPEEIISQCSCAEENANSVPHNQSSIECRVNDLPDCQVKFKDHVSFRQLLPSISSPPITTRKNSTNYKQKCKDKQTFKSPIASLGKENEYNNVPRRDVSHTDLINWSWENLTQNHSSSVSLKAGNETVDTQDNCDHVKYSKGSFKKRRHLRAILKSSQEEFNNINTLESTLSKHHAQVIDDTFKYEEINEKNEVKSGEFRSIIRPDISGNTLPTAITFHDSAKQIFFPVHNNSQPNTFPNEDYDKSNTFYNYDKAEYIAYSVRDNAQQIPLPDRNKLNNLPVHKKARQNKLHVNDEPNTLCAPDSTKPSTFFSRCLTTQHNCLTTQQNLASPSVQHRISESKTSTESNGRMDNNFVFSFADMNRQITASERVLSKLLARKRSQEQQESAASIFCRSKGIQANIASDSERIPLKPTGNVPLPPLRELVNQDNANLSGKAKRYRKRPRKTLGMYENLNKDVFNDPNNEVSPNPTTNFYNVLVSSSIKKRQILLENPIRSPCLLRSTRPNSAQPSKVNANLNSTSGYPEANGQDQSEVTIKISSGSQTDSRINSASSTLPTTTTTTNQQGKNRGVLSYFGNRLYKSNSPDRESSVDGDGYPKKIAASPIRGTASQTQEQEFECPNSLRKVECHHYHIVSDFGQTCVEEQGTQTEMTNPTNDRKKATKKKAVLPVIKERNRCEEKSPTKGYTIDIISPNVKENSVPQQESYLERKTLAEQIDKISGKGKKKAVEKQLQQAMTKAYIETTRQPENFKQIKSADNQRPELNNTTTTRPLNSAIQQKIPSPELNNTTTTRPLNSAIQQKIPSPESEDIEYYKTTYSDSFQDPEILKSFHDILAPDPDDYERMKKRKMLLESSQESDKDNFYRKEALDDEASSRFVAYFKTMQNKLRNPGSNMVSGSRVDEQMRSVSFDKNKVSSLPRAGQPSASNRLQRSKTAPASYTYGGCDGVLEDFKEDDKSAHHEDRWTLTYKAPDPPTAVIEQRKYEEAQEPARLHADSYYDPTNNVISVVVKPINVSLNNRLRNIRVKIYRSPPRLPPITCVPKQRKERTVQIQQCSAPLSRNILDRRAANPPFNTTTNKESDERYRRMFGHWQIL